MKNLLERMKTYNFWISLVSAIILVLRIIGDKFHFFVDATLIMDITTGLCGIFVVLGIISAPSGKKEEVKTVEEVTPVGRFEMIANAAEETTDAQMIDADCVEEDVILAKIEGEENEKVEMAQNEEIIEIENNNVEMCAETQENLQEENQNIESAPKMEDTDKQEIAELLTILLDKINSL